MATPSLLEAKIEELKAALDSLVGGVEELDLTNEAG